MRVQKIKDMFYYSMGMDRLTSKFLKFTRSHLCFAIASNIHSVFINILLLRQADDVKITIYYNMISFLTSGLTMVLAGGLSKRVNLKVITYIGIGFYIVAYGFFLVFMETISQYFILIAILMGAGGGFYFLTYFVLLSVYSTDDTRDVSLAFMGVLGSAIALAVPAVSGAVIGAFEGFTGYTVMFACAFAFSVMSMFLFSQLPKIERKPGKTQYVNCIKQIIANRCWRYVTLQIFTRSVRDGVFAFFLNVLLFQYVQNEAIIGFNSLWVGFVSIFAQFLCGKMTKPTNRIKIMMIATTILTAAGCLLYLGLNAVTVLLLSTVNAFFVVLLMNPASSIDFLIIQAMPDGYSCRNEYLGLFEVSRGTGRFVGLTILLCMPVSTVGYVSALVIVTAVQYLTVWSAKQAIKSVQEYQDK